MLVIKENKIIGTIEREQDGTYTAIELMTGEEFTETFETEQLAHGWILSDLDKNEYMESVKQNHETFYIQDFAKSAMNTKEFSISYSQERNEISGSLISYGDWYALDLEEIEELAKELGIEKVIEVIEKGATLSCSRLQ